LKQQDGFASTGTKVLFKEPCLCTLAGGDGGLQTYPKLSVNKARNFLKLHLFAIDSSNVKHN
jgi:hypothetical protein